MPVIHVEYNDTVPEDDMKKLAAAVQKIVSEVTSIEDVSVYANNSQIKVATSPIEIFIEQSAHKIEDIDALMTNLKSEMVEWKSKTRFPHKINMTIIPMKWKVEIDI